MLDSSSKPLMNIRRTLSIMVTYKCNAECENCGTFSNPRVRGRLNRERISKAIDQAQYSGFENVVFTGGEATLYLEDVLFGIGKAKECGLSSRLVTNAVWAIKKQKAEDTINRLTDAGLDEINLSTGDQHARFVPFEAVVNAATYAYKKRIRCHIMIERFRGASFSEKDFLVYGDISDAVEEGLMTINESPWMPLNPMEAGEYEEGDTANASNIDRFRGCDSVLQTYVLSTDEAMSVCCGLGSRFIKSLKSERAFEPSRSNSLHDIVFEAEQDFLKLWIRTYGPEKILEWAAKKDPTIKWENMYAHRCQACVRLYSDERVREVIEENYLEVVADVISKYSLGSKLENIAHEYVSE